MSVARVGSWRKLDGSGNLLEVYNGLDLLSGGVPSVVHRNLYS